MYDLTWIGNTLYLRWVVIAIVLGLFISPFVFVGLLRYPGYFICIVVASAAFFALTCL